MIWIPDFFKSAIRLFVIQIPTVIHHFELKTLFRHHNLFFQALAVQGLVADLRRWAPHLESNYPPSLISDAYVEALGELDPTLVPTMRLFLLHYMFQYLGLVHSNLGSFKE